jgi:putative phosphoribosyl transferase
MRLVRPVVPRWLVRRFPDRSAAGRALAERLKRHRHKSSLRVLALPRGGVPVAYEVALALDAPLDVLVVRKIGAPGHPELAIGAIASGGARVVNESVVDELGLNDESIARAADAEKEELARRERTYRGDRPPVDVEGRTVILVDDGLATGATMRAAALALRAQNPARVVVAVPVAAEQTCAELRDDVDEVVCALTPEPFLAVGAWYEDFSQTTDEEVRELLARANRQRQRAR